MKRFIALGFALVFAGGLYTSRLIGAEKATSAPVPAKETDTKPAEVKNSTPLPAEIQTIVERRCLKCHSKSVFFKSVEGLRASSAKQKIKKGKMPQPNSAQAKDFEGMDKSMLLDFLSTP